jgi:putative flippase GtrA
LPIGHRIKKLNKISAGVINAQAVNVDNRWDVWDILVSLEFMVWAFNHLTFSSFFSSISMLQRNKRLFRSLYQYCIGNTLVRWWIVGLLFTGINTLLLYGFVEIIRFPYPVATLIAAELNTVVRFLVNDRWVFHHPTPTWYRLWQYHLASLGGFLIWWSTVNLFPKLGVHYLIASVLATACSVVWSMASNFLWIWGKKTK